MRIDRRLLGPACLLLWLCVAAGLWLWHRADPGLPTLVRAPFEAGAAEAQMPAKGGRFGFVLAWPRQSASEMEDPVHVELAPEAATRGTISVGVSPADLAASAASLSTLSDRDDRRELDTLVPDWAAFRPWTYLGSMELRAGEAYIRVAFPDGLELVGPEARSRATFRTSETPSSRPLAPVISPRDLWIVPLFLPKPVSIAQDPSRLIYCAAAAAVLLLFLYGAFRRGAPAAGRILLAVWLVIVAAVFVDHLLYEARKMPIRVPLQNGVAAAEFDSRNTQIKFYLSFDDRPAVSNENGPAGPDGPRRIPLPDAAWSRGALTLSSTIAPAPDFTRRPCLISGRWSLLNIQGPMTVGMEKNAGAFAAASSWAYLGASFFPDGRNSVRFAMPEPPLPDGMPETPPVSLWIVPDPPDPLYDSLLKIYSAVAVGVAGLALLVADAMWWFLRKPRKTKSRAAS